MLELPYSRELESEADQVGLMFAAKVSFLYIHFDSFKLYYIATEKG